MNTTEIAEIADLGDFEQITNPGVKVEDSLAYKSFLSGIRDQLRWIKDEEQLLFVDQLLEHAEVMRRNWNKRRFVPTIPVLEVGNKRTHSLSFGTTSQNSNSNSDYNNNSEQHFTWGENPEYHEQAKKNQEVAHPKNTLLFRKHGSL